MIDLIVQASVIYAMDDQHHVYHDASLAIDAGWIVGIGPSPMIARQFPAQRALDAGDAAILPGFVDTHTHLPSTFLRGIYGVAAGPCFIPFLVTDFLEPAHTLAFARVACLEALASGTTTVQVSMNHMDAMAQAVLESGLRANLAEEICEMDYVAAAYGDYTVAPGQGERLLARALRFADEWQTVAPDRVQPALAPLAPDLVSPALYQQVVAEAARRDLLVTTHLAQSQREVRQVAERYGCSPVEHLQRIGVLGPRLMAAHCMAADAKDIQRLQEAGAAVLHCPRAYLLEGETAPVAQWRRAGVRVGLGTDDVHHSMWETLRTAYYASCVRAHQSQCSDDRLPFTTLLTMATRGGAEVLGMPTIGSLAIGKRADLQILDLLHPKLTPTADLPSSLVLYGSTDCVRSVLVGGEIVAGEGSRQSARRDAWVGQARDAAQEVWERIFARFPALAASVNQAFA
jgi:5-methylthioadenosine/S-adenosylhomocysteine deaminase